MGAHEITKIVESQFVGRQLRVKKHPQHFAVMVSVCEWAKRLWKDAGLFF